MTRLRAWVSILHRAGGVLMFLLLPFIIWMFDTSCPRNLVWKIRGPSMRLGFVPAGYIQAGGAGADLGLLHHFCAGLRHLWMDVSHSREQRFGKSSAVTTLAVSIGWTVVLGAKLFGLYLINPKKGASKSAHAL